MLTKIVWPTLIGLVIHCLIKYSKPEQRVFGPYVIIVTLQCLVQVLLNQSVLSKIESLREEEKSSSDLKELAAEFRDFYWKTFSRKSMISFIYFLAIGLSTPPMLKEAIAGQFPWSEVAAFMLYLAFMETISGMVILSMNAPFIIHTVTYTLSGVVLLILGIYEYRVHSKVNQWAERIANGSASTQLIFVPVV